MSTRRGTDTVFANPSGTCVAMILGMISPKVMINTVMIIVAIHAPPSPMSATAITVATDDAAMLTRLLPIKIVISALSYD
jgi:hypothetical protein